MVDRIKYVTTDSLRETANSLAETIGTAEKREVRLVMWEKGNTL